MSTRSKPAAPAEIPAWARDRLEEAPGWLASLLVHVLVLLVFWQIVLPLAQKSRPFETILVGFGAGEDPGIADGLAAMDAVIPLEVPERLEIPVGMPERARDADADPAAASAGDDADESEPSDSARAGAIASVLPPLNNSESGQAARGGPAGAANRGKPSRPAQRKSGGGSPAAKEQGRDLSDMLSGRGPEMRDKLIKAGGGNKASERAVEAGLEWLARHQQPDGSWTFQHGYDDPGVLECPTGATGLALLAFLGAGHTHRDGLYRSHVNEGLRYLKEVMVVSESGGWLRGTGHGTFYVQAICAIALCEAYSMSKDPDLKRPAQLAVDFIVNAQDPGGGGWRYRIHEAGDLSVVGWQLMALQSAKIAELSVPPRVITRATKFLKSVEFEGGASYGYRGAGDVRPTMTAVGLLCRMYLGREQNHRGMIRGMHRLEEMGPSQHDMYFNYYATQAMHHWGGPGWERWNAMMRDMLVGSQAQAGDAAGSWPTDGSHGAQNGGRLYTTCLSILTLEVYYRYLTLYRRAEAVDTEATDEGASPAADATGK
jgi:hypothetical protein